MINEDFEAANFGTGSQGDFIYAGSLVEPTSFLITRSNATSMERRGMSFATATRIK